MIVKIENALSGKPVKYFYNDSLTNDREAKKLKSYEEWTTLENPDFSPDYAFCNFVAYEYKVVFWPVSAFFDTMYEAPKNKKTVNYIRISVCRSQETIEKLRKYLKSPVATQKI